MEAIYHQRTWLSPVPTPPPGTGSFLLRSSVSPELKWILELSHWHRSALLYTHGRKLHKGRKTHSAVGRDTWTEQEIIWQTWPWQCLGCLAAAAGCGCRKGSCCTLTHRDMKLSINVTVFPLLTSSPWEMREASKWKQRPPQQYLLKTSYCEDLSQTTSSTAYLLCTLSCCHLFSLPFRFR